MSAPEIAALASARLCHDLISPIGAIGNGLELLRMTEGVGGEPELALISDSLGTALAKLRFYRIAFGPADRSARQSLDEARQITDAMFAGRFGVSWAEGEEDTMSRAAARVAYLAILCFERSLPLGGDVRVAVAGERIGLRAENCRIGAAPELWLHVTEGAPVPEPRPDIVQFPLLRRALVAQGYRAEHRVSESSAELRLTGPALPRAISA
ncbi:histidine phosphotransferase family protein [Amaricoccus solimangrovi]|uniref:Histidine phosphotransferase n=1 Tax=Amaricoccus solimangrovi TaxID=2589815 RepID=A0A501WJD9_9RHOB|nr:histidine phosphotransferase family protein [Amaricoccus solimangrovi]TPE48545.1 histidine phosphotransferase [Amaricoccus solimangrovi]